MRAVLYSAPRQVRVETVVVPPCGDDEVRLRVDACAVCGADLKAHLHGSPPRPPGRSS
jgi:threonine dehydrogenase-like Zn-dependent dehydrogenase